MPPSPTLNRKLHALLIGIDCYLPNRLPDGGSYPSLGGCVRDINHVESFFRDRLGLTDREIIKLTATNTGAKTPPEPKEQWPTYENMVNAFAKITAAAQPGEQVYVHYSGHGGRSVTAFPKVKGENGLDESLVPTDIGNSEARYLRDLEIALLLKRMTDKGLVVTLVFDSCHSGGATRGGGAGVAARGISSIDTTPRPTASLVASQEELEQTWQTVAQPATRSAKVSSGWIPEMNGAVLLAACRANELANEFAFEGTERNGALTYWLLDSLKQVGPTLTFNMLHDRVLAKVHAKFQQQTPQLHGDGSRVVFETNSVPRPPSARVIEVDRANKRVKVEAGQVQGVGKGAHFAVYAADATDFSLEGARLAIAEVLEAGDSESWAAVTDGSAAAVVEGAQAVLLDAGAGRSRGRIRLVERDDLTSDVPQAEALDALHKEIEKRKWITLAEPGEGADLQVAVNFNGEYEVWEPTGRIVSNLRPPLKVGEEGSAAALADRLVHLTKYNNVKLIENTASTSPLARQVTLTVDSETPKGPGGEVIVDVGEVVKFIVRNNSSQALNITVLDLQPDWGVSKLYPGDADSALLDPQDSVEIPLEFELPEGYKESLETIKVFATVGNTSFDWLTLPALDQPPPATRSTRSAGNDLERLLADFASDAPPERRTRARLANATISKWTTAQADVHVRHRPATIKHVREVSTSLLQSAFEQVAEKQKRHTRSAGGPAAGATTRASVADPETNAITAYFADPSELPDAVDRPREGTTRGVFDTVKTCANLAKRMASELWNAKVLGKDEEYNAAKAGLTAKFGDCDPRFAETLTEYAQFLLNRGEIPYRRWQQLSDFVIEGKLPAQARIGIIADWATGQKEALDVLRQVKNHQPHVVAHLGDVYYAGTAEEFENYFYKPWQEILEPEASGIVSFALPGNHDLYAGGKPFYELLDKLGQPASYFCMRNEHWQLIGLDTALNDKTFNPAGTPTTLDPKEVEWLRDKIENSGGRRTVLMSHHQLFSANDQFGEEKKSFNPLLYNQLSALLPKVDLWLWGHEHDLVVFGEYMGLKRGRCVGGSAFPVSKYGLPEMPKNADVPYNRQVVLSKGAAFYQHCYAILRLDGPDATLDYYEDSEGGRRLFSERI